MLYVLAGVLCLRNPLQTIAALSLITGVVWLVSGILTLYTAIAVEDLPHRGVLTVAAVLGIVAGIVVLALPAESARATPRSERWPRSGGGTVDRFDLVEKARAAGCRVVLLDADRHQDVTELARQAVAEGADLLAVARAATAPRRWWPRWQHATTCRSWWFPPVPATTSPLTSASTVTIRRPLWKP